MSRRVELLLFSAGWGANHFSTLLVVYRRDLGRFALPFVHATVARRLGDATTLLAVAAGAIVCLLLRAIVESAAFTRRSRTTASRSEC